MVNLLYRCRCGAAGHDEVVHEILGELSPANFRDLKKTPPLSRDGGVFLCAASSKQHSRCSGLPKGNPQVPQYCFSSSPKISGVALRFSGYPLFRAHIFINAAHSPFLKKPKVFGKLWALSEKLGFRTRKNFLQFYATATWSIYCTVAVAVQQGMSK